MLPNMYTNTMYYNMYIRNIELLFEQEFKSPLSQALFLYFMFFCTFELVKFFGMPFLKIHFV